MISRDPIPRETSAGSRLWRRWGGLVIGLGVLAILAGLLWYLLADTASTKREVAAPPMLMLPPPPPPPPEPEKLPEPEPEVKPEVVEPEPTPIEPLDTPPEEAPPSPSQDLGDPVTIDGAAQAGTDAFGVAAGRGGGSTGAGRGGLGNSAYSAYYASALQRLLARDARTRHLAFQDMRVDLWLSAEGRVAKAQLVQGTGDADIDKTVLAALRDADVIDERPPASMRYPMRITIKGQRPS
ncbi:energy transducer TonB [Pigmentiphaga sp. NML080357]|uniref:energy transducer TonB family protein n=1 Tax=Pigmentiphaga sp. NML080357 TaxID=2008675 RepID=UPI001E4C16AB|nr:energy transducer TonB [Pigmentiphaga sp. NML080357]